MEVFLKQAVAVSIVFPLLTAGSATRLTAATLAAGDFKVCRHTGGVWNVANPTTATPTEIGTTGLYALPLTAAELTPDDQQYPIIIACHDAAGAQWDDFAVYIRIFDNDIESLPAAVWVATTRTLTQAAASVAAAVTGSSLSVIKYVTYATTLSSLTIPATWTKVYLTAKSLTDSADAAAQLQIVVSNPGVGTDGLKYLIGTTAVLAGRTAADASLVVNQVAGTVAIMITDEATALMARGDYVYDLKCLLADGTSVLLAGTAAFTVGDAETRALI